MITINNFTKEYPKLKLDFPEPLSKEKFEKAKTMYENGMHKHSDTIEKYISTFVSKLNEFVSKNQKTTKAPQKAKSKSPATKKRSVTKSPKSAAKKSSSVTKKPKSVTKKPIAKTKAKATSKATTKSKKVTYDFKKREPKLPEEIRLFRRYLRLDGKKVTERQVLLLYRAIQKAAVTRTITKESKWKKEVEAMSRDLAETYNEYEGTFTFEIPATLKKKITEAVSETGQLTSVRLISSFLSFIMDQNEKKAKALKTRIQNALAKKTVPENDRYYQKVKTILSKLTTYINNQAEVSLPEFEINGLAGIAGLEKKKPKVKLNVKPGEIVSSVAVAEAHFERLPFTGKWKKFIGEPDEPFAIMIFGRPGQGKSTLAIQFAKYLAENFGKVLYVGKEEGVSGTLQEKINRLNASDSNLFFTSNIPGSFKGFKYIFLDSINALNLSADQLRKMYEANPTKSFISVFKGTKSGDFRGSLEYEHDVDASIKCEKGKAAHTKNRFGGEGEMKIW